jgi:hypothetical protein
MVEDHPQGIVIDEQSGKLLQSKALLDVVSTRCGLFHCSQLHN